MDVQWSTAREALVAQCYSHTAVGRGSSERPIINSLLRLPGGGTLRLQ